MTATFWHDQPKNRYAAERAGLVLPSEHPRDAHAVRRRTTALLAGVFLAVNVALLAALAPAVMQSVGAAVTLPQLAAPAP